MISILLFQNGVEVEFKSTKSVLCSNSLFFRNILSVENSKYDVEPIILPVNDDSKSFVYLLQYMNSHVLKDIPEEHLLTSCRLASVLSIVRLLEDAKQYMISLPIETISIYCLYTIQDLEFKQFTMPLCNIIARKLSKLEPEQVAVSLKSIDIDVIDSILSSTDLKLKDMNNIDNVVNEYIKYLEKNHSKPLIFAVVNRIKVKAEILSDMWQLNNRILKVFSYGLQYVSTAPIPPYKIIETIRDHVFTFLKKSEDCFPSEPVSVKFSTLVAELETHCKRVINRSKAKASGLSLASKNSSHQSTPNQSVESSFTELFTNNEKVGHYRFVRHMSLPSSNTKKFDTNDTNYSWLPTINDSTQSTQNILSVENLEEDLIIPDISSETDEQDNNMSVPETKRPENARFISKSFTDANLQRKLIDLSINNSIEMNDKVQSGPYHPRVSKNRHKAVISKVSTNLIFTDSNFSSGLPIRSEFSDAGIFDNKLNGFKFEDNNDSASSSDEHKQEKELGATKDKPSPTIQTEQRFSPDVQSKSTVLSSVKRKARIIS